MATEFISNSWLMPTNANAEANRVSNYSLDFDGTQFVNCGNDSSLNTNAVTISCWLKCDPFTPAVGPAPLSKDAQSNPNRSYGFLFVFTDFIFQTFDSAGNENRVTIAQASNPINTSGNWHHLVGIIDGTTNANGVKVYIDNVLVGQATATATGIRSSTENFIIGGSQGGNLYNWNGNITEVSIFDYSLSASQVTELYGTGSAIGNPMAITNGRKPVAYYPLGNSAFNGEFLTPNGAEQDYVFDFVSADGDRILCSPTATPGTGPINSINGTITVGIWINSTQSSVNAYPMNRDYLGGPNSDWRFRQRSDTNLIQLYLFNTSSTTLSVELTGSNDPQGNPYIVINDGNWHQIVMVYNGTDSAELYTDGVLQGSTTISGFGTLKASARTVIGGVNNSGNPYAGGGAWNGKLSNAQIWDTNLSSAEITTLYNYGTPYTGTQPQAANLQGWWELNASATFDGSVWSIPDASSNSNTGTSSGMTAANLVQSDLIINAPYDSFSLQMDGIDEYISVLNNGFGLTTAITVSAWVKVPSGGGSGFDFYTFIAEDDFGGTFRNWYFGWRAGYDDFYFSVFHSDNTSTELYSNVGDINDGKWHHVVGVFDGTTSANAFKLYVDNVAGQTTAGSTGINNASVDALIGATKSSAPARKFEGQISNVSVFNTSLTSAQVKTLYNEHKPFDLNTFAVTPVSWWRLGSVNTFYNSTTTEFTVLDEVGTNNGTSVNMEQGDLVTELEQQVQEHLQVCQVAQIEQVMHRILNQMPYHTI